MITRKQLADITSEELIPAAGQLIKRLPILATKFEEINGKRVALYDEKTILHKLKTYKCRRAGKTQRAKDEMVKYLEGLDEILS